MRFPLLPLLIVVMTACADSPEPPPGAENPQAVSGMAAPEAPDSLTRQPLADLGGPGMENLRAHLNSIEGLSGARLEAVRDAHSELIRSTLARIMTDFAGLTMVSGELQGALRDVRQDWERIPTLSPDEFEAFLPEHLTRVIRLIDMHRQRMAEAHMG